MLIQRAGTGTRPPPGFTKPFWSHLVERWDAGAGKIRLPLPVLGPTTITMGHDDSEADDYTVNGHIAVEGPERIVDREFGWDNESPARRVKVGKFKAEWSPVTNAQFERFWRSENSKGNVVAMPASWVLEGEAVMVRSHHESIQRSRGLLCHDVGANGVRPRIDGHRETLGRLDVVRRLAQVRAGKGGTTAY